MYDQTLLKPPIEPRREDSPVPLWNRLTCPLNWGKTCGVPKGTYEYFCIEPSGEKAGPFTMVEICSEYQISTHRLCEAIRRGGKIILRKEIYQFIRARKEEI